MNLGIHIIKNPAGTYSYAGTLPTKLATPKPATRADVMGGRSFFGSDGAQYAWKFPTFHTVEESIEHATDCGVELCSSDSCACRNHF